MSSHETNNLGFPHPDMTIEEARELLEEEVKVLRNMHKQIKRKSKELDLTKLEASSTQAEVTQLAVQVKQVNSNLIYVKQKIKDKKKRIARLEVNFDVEVQYIREDLWERKEETERQFIKAQLHAADLHLELEDLQFRFDEYGSNVRVSVDKRTEQYISLDAYTAKLGILQAEDDETDVDYFDSKDHIRFIDASYPYYQSVLDGSLDDFSNIENPVKCVEAMNAFVKVIHENLYRFKHLPIGPLFKNMVVKNKRWAALTEFVLRPLLFSFLVDNIVDSLVMDELIAQHFPKSHPGSVNSQGVICPRSYIFEFQNQYEIGSSINAVSGLELENMMEVAQFDNQLWAKFLSYKINMEKVIFMENEHAAFLVMSTVKQTPWHCQVAYTLDGYIVRPFPCFKTKKIQSHHRAVYLKCLPNPEIMGLRAKIRRTEKTIVSLSETINLERDRQLEVAERLDSLRPLLRKAKREEAQYFKEKEALEAKLYESVTVESEKRKLKRLRNQRKQLVGQAADVETKFKEKTEKLCDIETKALKDEVALEWLRCEFDERDLCFFANRDALWKREEEENTIIVGPNA